MLFGRDGAVGATAQAEIKQHFPHPGWVEHDAQEIWQSTLDCVRQVMGQRGPDAIAAIGITN